MPQPKIYLATEQASLLKPIRPLRGTRISAQQYVDRVTRSGWWRRRCPGYFVYNDPAPSRVWVFQGAQDLGGYVGDECEKDGEILPAVCIGFGKVNGDVVAMADRWVLLHELAHIMTNHALKDGHHGPQFIAAFVGLVAEFLGIEHASNLVAQCKINKIRLDYRLLV